MSMNDNLTKKPDYESECNRLTELNQQLMMKLSEAEAIRKGMEEEMRLMRAQLEVVYLIFGSGRLK